MIATKISVLLQVLTNLVSQAKLLSVLNEDLMASIIGGIAQQAVERIDGIRAQAGTVFSALIHRLVCLYYNFTLFLYSHKSKK